MRRFIIDNALMWLRDYHVDGLRLDAVHALVDDVRRATCSRSSPPTVERARGARCADRCSLIAGVRPQRSAHRAAAATVGGYGLDAQWSDDFHHALHAVLTGETQRVLRRLRPLADAGTALRQRGLRPRRHAARPSAGRVHGRLDAGGLPACRFVGSSRTTTRWATAPPASASPNASARARQGRCCAGP